MGIIYKITNKQGNKVYIGKRMWTPKQFFSSSYYGSGIYIKRTIEKIGKDCFDREILEEIDDPILLSNRERYWIAYYKSNQIKFGYNLSEGGEQLPGFHHSETTKQKIGKSNSIALLGNKLSDETKEKISQFNKGKIISEEHRKKISDALSGIPKSEEHIRNNRLSKLGKSHSVEHNKNIQKSAKKWHENIGFSEESIHKMRLKQKLRFSNDAERKKMSIRMMGHTVSDETRRKISETLKAKRNLTDL